MRVGSETAFCIPLLTDFSKGPFSVEDLLSSYSIEGLLVSPVNNYEVERLISGGSMPPSATSRMYADGLPVADPSSGVGLGVADGGVSNGMANMNMNGVRQSMMSH